MEYSRQVLEFHKYFVRHKPEVLPFDKKINGIVVIPVFADFMIFDTLKSIEESKKNEKNFSVGIVVVLNHSKKASDNIKKKNNILFSKLKSHKFLLPLHIIRLFEVEDKFAGVGIARKVGMDAAAFHFYSCDQTDGLIFSLDADTVVGEKYFEKIFDEFYSNKKISGASIYYEHPMPLNRKIKDAIVQYELHLRYYVNMLRLVQFPFAFHTVGSAFVVDYKSYLRQNGMPKKQGGEDFYFLNKVMLEGNYCDICSTSVYPYGRPTKKTPFGTGMALHSILSSEKKVFYTYHYDSFLQLKKIIDVNVFFEDFNCEEYVKAYESVIQDFLKSIDFCKKIELIKKNTSNFNTFKKAFYTWFDGFKAVKFLNYIHNVGKIERIPVVEAAKIVVGKEMSSYELLNYFRELDKKNQLCLNSDFELYEK